MNIKAFALGGAALFLATTAYASQPPSSPAERAQTQKLNEQSLQAAQGQAMNTSQDQTSASAAQPSGNMAASNDSAAANPAAAPTPQVAQNDMAPASGPLAAMSSPPTALNTASVVDSSGATVGAVSKVEVSASGAPLTVDVTLSGQTGHVVAIDASKLTYDSSTNVLTAQASAGQIKAMPSVPQS